MQGILLLKNINLKKIHEDILVFSTKPCNFNPQKTLRDKPIKHGANKCLSESSSISCAKEEYENKIYEYKEPESIINISNRSEKRGYHPTQKPIALFEYIIRTYSNESDIVLDNCIGSGTTAIACINTNRNYIGFELDKHYCDIANERIESVMAGQMELKGV